MGAVAILRTLCFALGVTLVGSVAAAQVAVPGTGFAGGNAGLATGVGGAPGAIAGGTMGPNAGAAVPGGASGAIAAGTMGPNAGGIVPGGASAGFAGGTMGPSAGGAIPGRIVAPLGTSTLGPGAGARVSPVPSVGSDGLLRPGGGFALQGAVDPTGLGTLRGSPDAPVIFFSGNALLGAQGAGIARPAEPLTPTVTVPATGTLQVPSIVGGAQAVPLVRGLVSPVDLLAPGSITVVTADGQRFVVIPLGPDTSVVSVSPSMGVRPVTAGTTSPLASFGTVGGGVTPTQLGVPDRFGVTTTASVIPGGGLVAAPVPPTRDTVVAGSSTGEFTLPVAAGRLPTATSVVPSDSSGFQLPVGVPSPLGTLRNPGAF